MADPDHADVRRTRQTFATCGISGLAVAAWLVVRWNPAVALVFLVLILPTLTLVIEAALRRVTSTWGRPGKSTGIVSTNPRSPEPVQRPLS